MNLLPLRENAFCQKSTWNIKNAIFQNYFTHFFTKLSSSTWCILEGWNQRSFGLLLRLIREVATNTLIYFKRFTRFHFVFLFLVFTMLTHSLHVTTCYIFVFCMENNCVFHVHKSVVNIIFSTWSSNWSLFSTILWILSWYISLLFSWNYLCLLGISSFLLPFIQICSVMYKYNLALQIVELPLIGHL